MSVRWPNYFNIVYPDGREDGLYLRPNTRWTFRHPNSNNAAIESIRSSDNLPILKPTPDTTPEQVILGTSDNCSHDVLNKSIIETPQHDMPGNQLDPSHGSTLERIDFSLPRDLLNQVYRLDSNLPLTSTWNRDHIPNSVPTAPSKTKRRIAHQRRHLPAESEIKGFLPIFAQRLNPFKKKEDP